MGDEFLVLVVEKKVVLMIECIILLKEVLSVLEELLNCYVKGKIIVKVK